MWLFCHGTEIRKFAEEHTHTFQTKVKRLKSAISSKHLVKINSFKVGKNPKLVV